MISNIKPICGNLLLQFPSVHVEKTVDGIVIDPTFELEKHQQTVAIVAAVSGDEYCYRDEHHISIDTRVGDTVIISYLAAQRALACGLNNFSGGTWIIGSDGLLYATVHASNVLAYVRDGELHAACGYLLARPVKKNLEINGVLLSLDVEDEARTFEVITAGAKVLNPDRFIPSLHQGDIIQTLNFCGFPLEYGEHRLVTTGDIVVFEQHRAYAILQQAAAA